MKQNKLKLLVMAAIAVAAGGYCGVESFNNDRDGFDSLLLMNVEALTADDDDSGNQGKLDCSYTPVPQPCSMWVSAEVAAKVFGMHVAAGTGSVEVTFTGAQECQGKGTITCRPVRCHEIIQSYLSVINH